MNKLSEKLITSDSEASDDEEHQTCCKTPKRSYSFKELKKIAKDRGIKYYGDLSKEDLCEVLCIECGNDSRSYGKEYTFTNHMTGYVHRFKNINKASKHLGLSRGKIFHSVGKEIMIDRVVFLVGYQ